MANVKIELDLSIVQEAIKTHTLAAVTAILDEHYDIPRMVKDELLREPKKEEQEEYRYSFPMMYMNRPTRLYGKAMIEGMVKDAIHEEAEEYVKAAVNEQKQALHAAFKRMMQKSPDKLAKAFVAAVETGVASNWSFEIDTKVSVKKPDSDYD